jgi:hypothetical protein
MAHAIERELHDTVLPELVAEARASGVHWDAIGKALGVSKTAAHNKYGNSAIPDRGNLPIMEDKVVQLTNQILTNFPDDSPDWDALRDELGETTPQERMRYALKLMCGARNSYEAAENELALPLDERDEKRFHSTLFTAHKKLMTLTQTITIDPEQWAAVPDWAEQPEIPDASHYHAPVMYIFYAMRLLFLASEYDMMALNSGLDFEERIRLFRMARNILEQAMMVLLRKDVYSAIYEIIVGED